MKVFIVWKFNGGVIWADDGPQYWFIVINLLELVIYEFVITFIMNEI